MLVPRLLQILYLNWTTCLLCSKPGMRRFTALLTCGFQVIFTFGSKSAATSCLKERNHQIVLQTAIVRTPRPEWPLRPFVIVFLLSPRRLAQ